MKKIIVLILTFIFMMNFSAKVNAQLNQEKKILGIPEDKIAHIGGGLIGGSFAYGGAYWFLTQFTSLDHRYSKVISGIFATSLVAVMADYKERHDDFYSKKDLVAGIIPAGIISIGLSFTFGKPPKPTLRKARNNGIISDFTYQYMNTLYKRSTEQDYEKFIREFEELEAEAFLGEQFVPEIERLFLRDSLFIEEGSPYPILEKARDQSIITPPICRRLKKMYKTSYKSYDLIQMKEFKERYDDMKESVENE